MKFHIIMPYRPLSFGSLNTPEGSLEQIDAETWRAENGIMMKNSRDDIYRAIHFLRKNSVEDHHIIVAIDSDVHPMSGWLSEYENLSIVQSSYVCPPGSSNPPYRRLCTAYESAVNSVPDGEWITYGYTCDLICCKRWDAPIMQAIGQYGDGYVFVPMFVEMKDGSGYASLPALIKGVDPTPQQIWVDWRQQITCHDLTWPETNADHLTEEDFDHFIARANEYGQPWVIEPCGTRNYGYYNVMTMKAERARQAGFSNVGLGFDLAFDDALRDRAGMQKVVITNSYVYHPQSETYYIPFRWK